jgi:hypothetical protein
VVRYEHNRVPRGKALARLESIASANGFEELASVFRKALNREFAVPTPTPRGKVIQFRNDDEVELVQALLDVMRHDEHRGLLDATRQEQYSKAAATIRRVLKPVIADRRRADQQEEAREGQRRAIVRLLETDHTVEEVTRVFRTDVETVAQAFFDCAGPTLTEKRMRDVVGALIKDGWSIRRMADEFGNGEAADFIDCAAELGEHRVVSEYEEAAAEEENAEKR